MKQTAEKEVFSMLKAGVSTACLYPQPTEESLYDLALGGVTTVEVFINAHAELKRLSLIHI